MENDKLGLKGKTIGEVSEILDAIEHTFRVVERDGVGSRHTMDVVKTRVNLKLVDRKVVSYTLG